MAGRSDDGTDHEDAYNDNEDRDAEVDPEGGGSKVVAPVRATNERVGDPAHDEYATHIDEYCGESNNTELLRREQPCKYDEYDKP